VIKINGYIIINMIIIFLKCMLLLEMNNVNMWA